MILGEGAASMRVLVFNVKGEDLLFLDHRNLRLGDGAGGGAHRLLEFAKVDLKWVVDDSELALPAVRKGRHALNATASAG